MIFMTYPSVHIKQSILYSVVILYEYSHHRNFYKIPEDHLMATFKCLQCSFYCMKVCWNRKTVLAFLFSSWLNHCESSRRETKRERPAICAFIMWLFGATVQTTDGLQGPISLSIHSFIGLRWFPPSRPLRGPHLITDHHSHLACVPFQLSAQFLSDDPREPQAHWPRLVSPNRSLSRPSRFCTPDPPCDSPTDPLPAHSDPEWKADASWHVTWRATYE